MAYTKAQCVAFAIATNWDALYTATGKTDPKTSLPIHKKDETPLGDSDEQADAKARCHILLRAIEEAATAAGAGDAETLRIFMAPEFFFRGRRGAYSLDTAHTIISTLQDGTKDTKWSHWLFVLGSIVASWEEIGTDGKAQTIVHNFVLVQKGGAQKKEDAPQGAHVVVKEHKSGIDFMKGSAYIYNDYVLASDGKTYMPVPAALITPINVPVGHHVDETVAHLPVASASGAGKEQSQREYDGLSVFNAAGITFGLEICLDHAAHRLKMSPPTSGQQLVQIQLIPSAGMNIKPEGVIACTGGLVFNCDGIKPGSSQVMVVTKAHTASDPATVQAVAALPDVPFKGDKAVDVTRYFTNTGKIQIYPAHAVPAGATAKDLAIPSI